MAGATEDLESSLILAAVIAIGLFALFAIYSLAGGLQGFAAWLKNQLGNGQANLQSFKNAYEGFPDGADPGTIPGFDLLQGMAESIRNFGDYVLGSDEDNAAKDGPSTTYAPAAPTPAQIADVQNGLNTYEQFAASPTPWQDQAEQWMAGQLF